MKKHKKTSLHDLRYSIAVTCIKLLNTSHVFFIRAKITGILFINYTFQKVEFFKIKKKHLY
jgi:hypothetical protein